LVIDESVLLLTKSGLFNNNEKINLRYPVDDSGFGVDELKECTPDKQLKLD
jgi:hypothetical protein